MPKHSHKTQKYKTCKRFNDPGHAHSLTFSCFHRQPFLSRDRSRHWFLESVGRAKEMHHFDLWAYVVMPEHVHLLIWPRDDDYSISEILTEIKQPVTRRAIQWLKKQAPEFLVRMMDLQPNRKVSHRFWQRGGGYDRNIIEPNTIHAEIEYIHANPVRKELTDTPEDWPWSSARYFAGRSDGFLAPDIESIPGYS